MKTSSYLQFFAFIIALAYATELETSLPAESVELYLSRKLREIKIDIAKSYSPDPPLDRIYDVRWDRLWERNLNSAHPLALSFFNETFVLADEHVLRVEIDVSDSKKPMLHEVAVISQQKTAKFVRTIAWKESLYLLICQEDGSCSLHVGPNTNELRYRQIVKHRGLPMDAKFFTQANQLYLVVADNSGQFSVPSVIYRWTGTYMDVIAEVSTTGAISVTTFNHKHSTIVIFAQNVQGRPKIGSEVFKFKNGLVEKIQFLATDAPTLIQHYKYGEKMFLLVINEFSASRVFWWDGKEFLNWMELPEIRSPTKVNIVYADGDTLLLVSQENTLSLYRIKDLAYTKLTLLEMKDRSMITDFNARVTGNTIILVLVTKSEGNFYHVEPIELVVRKSTQENPTEETDPTWEYLTQLNKSLEDRMPEIEKAHEFWPSLLPFSENIVITSPLEFKNLVIESGDILDLRVSSPADIMTPTELASGLEQINIVADSLISKSNEFLFPNDTAELKGKVVVKGDAFFDELHVDSLTVNVLNDQKIDFDDILSYTKDQDFATPLQGNIVTIKNLEIDSLCGIPFENWQMRNDTDKTGLNFFAHNVKIIDETILVQSDLSLDNLGVSKINNLDLKSFFDDLFIVGMSQEVKGSIFYKRGLNAHDLRINATNGISADQLLTKTTDQQLGDFSIKNLNVDDLFVETINNVSVNNAARISEENVVSGQVTFRNLRITDELSVEGVSVLFDLRPIQIYKNVEINGDLTIRSLDLISGGSLYLNNSKVEIDSLFRDYWRKSTNQTISHNVTLAGGISIDDLYADYLNGYGENDFLYTTAREISEKFGALHFKRFEIEGSLFAEKSEPVESFISDNNLIINQKIQLKDLKVGNLNAETYNKIPINDIVWGKNGVNISGTIKYKNLQVVSDLRVGNLLVKFLNGRDMASFFEEALLVDKNYAIDNLQVRNLETDNFEVEELNGLRMKDFYRMLIYKDITAIKNVTIEGNLLVNGNLKVEYINDISSADFIEILSNDDIELKGDEITFDEFVVYGNLSANLLRDIKIEDLAENTLSRTKAQRITGEYNFFHKLQADNLIAQEINGFDLSSLKLVSDPLIFEGDVIFSDLFVESDIITAFFNGQDIAEIYDGALQVPFTRIANLTITGNIDWEDSAMELKSLSYLFSKAVTKNTNQTIKGEVIFSDPVCAHRLNSSSKNIGDVDISAIVSDAVIAVIGQPIVIKGQKVLKKGLTAKRLTVPGNIDIANINDSNILELNSTIVRKFDTQTISGATILRGDVTIERLKVAGKVHGLKTQGIVTFNDTLPSNTRFAKLDVQNGMYAKKLDGIDFEEFIKNRVTLDGNHEIYNDVVFLDPVIVTQNAVLSSINGIDLSDVVLSGTKHPQIISGGKIMTRDLIVHGKVNVGMINDIRITEEYNDGIFNNEDVHINGNIIFAADLETNSSISVTGLVNGVDLNDQFSENISTEALKLVQNLERDQLSVDKMIDRSVNYTQYLQDVFFYFDVQPELFINAPNIRKIETLNVESMTKLNLYGTDKGHYCGLPDFCPCPNQYVAELLDNECKIWKINGSQIIYNSHDSNGRFGVNIISNTTSTSNLCSQKNPQIEFTTITWMTPHTELLTGHILGEIRNNSLKINGYLSDVKTFTIGEKLYIVLAIYYIAEVKSHDVNSLVYEINLASNEIKLLQAIPTTGAVALDVFATRLHGMHLLIACGHDPAESQLHRFNIRDSKFELLRTFRTGGSMNVKSIIQEEESFVLLDDPLANSVHIFNYNIQFDNYHFYQSLYHESPVKNIEVFYSGEFGASDTFLIVTTDEGRFFLYEYMFIGGFQLRAQQWLDGVQTMAPFHFSNRRYIFAGTVTNSTVYRIVKQGPNYN